MLTFGRIYKEPRLPSAKLGRSAYADPPLPSSRTQTTTLRNMFSTTPNAPEERPARKLKKENRFYNFLTRSRSRSHSKTDLSPPVNPSPSSKSPRKEHSESKPPYRIPSRPISSTTTATNSTITPATPKSRKHTSSSIPVPSTRPSDPPESDVRRSRPTSPTHSTTSRRKFNIFGISISGSRRPSLSSSKSRSRSHSRPTSPRVLLDIPPLPTSGFEDDSRTIQPSQSSSSRPASPPASRAKTEATTAATPLSLGSLASASHGHDPPTTNSQATRDANGLELYGGGSSKLRGFFAGKDSSSRSRHQGSSGVPATLVSAPVKRVSSLKRRSINKALPDRPTSPPIATDPRPSSPPHLNPNSNIPRIINTPATPVRAATISGGNIKPPPAGSSSTSKTGFGVRNRSLDTGYRYRRTMDVVNEEGRLSRESKEMQAQHQQESAIPRLTVSKGREKEPESSAAAPRTNPSRMSTSVRNAKHGSFDFERPGLGAIALQRTGSNGTSTTVTSGWSRNEVSNVRESTWGPGLAGVGTIQRDASMKRGKERDEKVKERAEKAKEMKKQAKEGETKKKAVAEDFEPVPPKANPSPAHSSNGHQTPPSGTTSGNSSSLSKASGKRFFGKGSSGSRNTTQHGLFSFEPPVPSPTWSATSVITAKEISASWVGGRMEKDLDHRPQKEKTLNNALQGNVDRRPSQSQRQERLHIPVITLPNTGGNRSGVKGRSLDLNIGLAWAPSKVRKDALLTSSSLFKRSLSNSSSVKSASGSRSASSSLHGHDSTTTSRENEATTMDQKSKIGREIAELFRKALGEPRYMRFKTYIYQFDAHEIPFDGPTGIISKVDALLATVPTMGLDEKRRLMDKFVRIILQNA